MNDSIPTHLITWMKRINSLKDTIWQNLHKKTKTILKGLYLLNKLNRSLITLRSGKHQAKMCSLVKPTKHLRQKLYQSYTIPFRALKQREYFLTHLWGQHYLNTKARQRGYKNPRLQTNTSQDHRCQYPPRNTSNSNPTMHLKNHRTWISGIYHRYARLAQQSKIN